jgi:hypothetical protein
MGNSHETSRIHAMASVTKVMLPDGHVWSPGFLSHGGQLSGSCQGGSCRGQVLAKGRQLERAGSRRGAAF